MDASYKMKYISAGKEVLQTEKVNHFICRVIKIKFKHGEYKTSGIDYCQCS